MVVLNLKRADKAQFLYETTVKSPIKDILKEVALIYNGRLKIERLCQALEQLAQHGIMKPPQMQGLTDDQIEELKLKDETEKYYPSGGTVTRPDGLGLRTGQAPVGKIADMIRRTVSEARQLISKDQVKANIKVDMQVISDCFDKLRGATMIAYPMGLPSYETTQQILEDKEELAGTQAEKDIIPESNLELWWAGKCLTPSKLLQDFIGKNEKTKIICKIQKSGQGAPSREPTVDEETQKQMMAFAYKRQQELKKLEEAEDDDYLNSPWADGSALKNKLQGTGNVQWR